MNTRIFNPSRIFGFGLLESMLSLLIGLSLILGIAVLLTPADTATSVAQETARLDRLRSALSTAYVSAVDFTGLTQSHAAKQGWLTKGSGTADATAWGSFELTTATTHGVAADSWAVQMTNVPSDACGQLVGGERGDRWASVYLDGKPITDGDASGCYANADTHELRFEAWGGRRAGALTLAPLCVDAERGVLPECPANPVRS